MNVRTALTNATIPNGPKISRDKNFTGLTAAKTAPMATAARKINNHQPAILALLGEIRFYQTIAETAFCKKKAMRRTTIIPLAIMRSREPVSS